MLCAVHEKRSMHCCARTAHCLWTDNIAAGGKLHYAGTVVAKSGVAAAEVISNATNMLVRMHVCMRLSSQPALALNAKASPKQEL